MGQESMNSGWVYHDRLDRRAAGQTVLDFYVQRYRHSSAQDWSDRLVAGQITLNDRPTTATTILATGQRLAYHRPPWIEPPVPLDWQVIAADGDFAAIAKPAGLPVLPGGGFVEHTLLWQVQRSGALADAEDPPVPIHRLGRGTSGLVLLARSPLARANLTRQLRDRQITKIYRALVQGVPPWDNCTIRRAIGKISHPTLGYVYGAVAETSGASPGLDAHSEAQVLQRAGDRAIVEVQIFTGRPHQIRIHLAAVGFPLLGDPLYLVGGWPRGCGDLSWDPRDTRGNSQGNSPRPAPHVANYRDKAPIPVPGDCGYWLHAHRLSFVHPRTGRSLTLTAPPPPMLQGLSLTDPSPMPNPPMPNDS